MPNGNPETIPYGYSFLSPGLTSLTRFSMACRYVSFAYLLPFSALSRSRWSCAFLAICSGARQPKFNPFWNRASGINDLYRYGQGSCCPIVGTSIRAFHGLHDDACPAGGHYLSTQSARSRFTTTIWSTRLTFHGTSPRNRDDIILPVRFVTQQHFLGGFLGVSIPRSTNGSDQTGQQKSTSSFAF